MARKLRIQYEGALYHVINRGNYRRDVFSSPGAAQAFVELLGEALPRFGWRLHAFVIMRNHFHLALETPDPNLVDGMHWLQSSYATRFNRFRQERGHLFQGRYQAILVEDFTAMGRVVDYIHLNPVRAAIVPVEQVAAFRWSSLLRFVKGPRFPGLVAAEWLAKRGGWGDTTDGWRGYLGHLAALSANSERQKEEGFEGFDRGWAIGTSGWRRALAKDHADRALHPGIEADEVRSFKAARWSVRLDSLLSEAGQTLAGAAGAPKGDGWKLTIALRLRQETGASVKWIAEQLGMGSPETVRSRLSKAKRQRAKAAPTSVIGLDRQPEKVLV